MPKKKNFSTSYGYLGWVEKYGKNIEFVSENEYLEYVKDKEE